MSLNEVRARIRDACKKSGRDTSSVTLVAVSKFQPVEKIRELLDQGHRVFGENRVQEAKEKYTALRAEYPDLQLHFIGQLQTNKVKDAVKIFDVIETLDRPALSDALSQEMEKQKRNLPCFIQVNSGNEEQKGGVTPDELPEFLRYCRKDAKLNVTGLMCIPPQQEIPDLHFALMHKIAREFSLPQLSMGMSGDFETAIRYGATAIRVGTALFGPRKI